MKKTPADDLRPEYDFDYKQARTNRFAGRVAEQPVVVLDPDVAEVFSTPEEVNRALRALIAAMPKTRYPKSRQAGHTVSEE